MRRRGFYFDLLGLMLLAGIIGWLSVLDFGPASDSDEVGAVYVNEYDDVRSSSGNVILFIGDGMGTEQVRAGGFFIDGKSGSLLFEAFPYKGQVMTANVGGGITDSAAAASAMATGQKTANGVISTGAGGEDLQSLLEYYKTCGKATGLVTTAYISHATPAAFGAHEASRYNYRSIISDYLDSSRPRLLYGGARFVSVADAQAAGYEVVTNRADMQAIVPELVGRVWGMFGSDAMPYMHDGLGVLPELSEMTRSALEILDGDPDGFFLMVEGGRIDHAGHERDIAKNVAETVEFADAVAEAVLWAKGRADTLIVVTADHETGGLRVLGGNGIGNMPTVTWSTDGHTGRDVPLYATGKGAEAFTGTIENSELYGLILRAVE